MADVPPNLLWEQYKHCVDLHRGYLDLVIKINIFYYAVTGAIISFYFVNLDHSLIKFSLILPFVMSIALAIFFFRSANAADISQKDLENIAAKLGFDVFSAVAAVLAFLLRIFFWLMIVSMLGIMVLFFQDNIISIIECIREK